MNDAYGFIAILGVLGLLVIVYFLHRSQREIIRENARTNIAMSDRVANLEDQFLALPLTQERMRDTVRDGINPLNKRLDSTDKKIAELYDLATSIANKVGA